MVTDNSNHLVIEEMSAANSIGDNNIHSNNDEDVIINEDIFHIKNVAKEVIVCCENNFNTQQGEQTNTTTSKGDIKNNEEVSHIKKVVVHGKDGNGENKQRKRDVWTWPKIWAKRKRYCKRRKLECPQLRKFQVANENIPDEYEEMFGSNIKEFDSCEEKVKAHNYLALHLFKLPPLNIIDLEKNMNPKYNDRIMNRLKKRIDFVEIDLQDRFIILMFYEMPVLAQFQYISIRGILSDYEEDNYENTFGIKADHSQIFMVRSVYRTWSMPVSYMFSKGEIKTSTMVIYIKEIVKRLTKMGFTVASLVCAPNRANRAAIKMLLKDTQRLFTEENRKSKPNIIRIDESEMVPIYDIRYIFKGIRNHLLNKNLSFCWEGNTLTACWKDVVATYLIEERKNERWRLCNLTKKHVFPKRIPMMDVSKAVEVFTHKVGVAIVWANKSNSPLGIKNTMCTAQLCSFIGNLYESLNIGALQIGNRNVRKFVTMQSNHLKIWQEAIEVVESMRFVFRYGNEEVLKQPRVLHILKTTIKRFITLRSMMLKMKHITCLPTKSFTQEPMDNSFCILRQTHFPNKRNKFKR